MVLNQKFKETNQTHARRVSVKFRVGSTQGKQIAWNGKGFFGTKNWMENIKPAFWTFGKVWGTHLPTPSRGKKHKEWIINEVVQKMWQWARLFPMCLFQKSHQNIWAGTRFSRTTTDLEGHPLIFHVTWMTFTTLFIMICSFILAWYCHNCFALFLGGVQFFQLAPSRHKSLQCANPALFPEHPLPKKNFHASLWKWVVQLP